MKIGFISGDWSFDFPDAKGEPTPGGTGWYRVHMPARTLAENGFDVVVGGIPDTKDGWLTVKDWHGREHTDLDVVIVQRWMHAGAARMIQLARKNGQVVLSDIDDWYRGLAASSVAFDRTHPRAGTQLLNRQHARWLKANGSNTFNRNNLEDANAASTAIICSTPFLVEKYEKTGRPVFLCRNAIDMGRWPLRDVTLSGSKPTIGWVGSTATRSGDLEVMRAALPLFIERAGSRVFHGGQHDESPDFADVVGVDKAHVTAAPMLPIESYPAFFTRFDIGIVPLTDRSFNHAKSAIKGMEYAAAGVPFVASDLPEYRWLYEQHGIGRIAKRHRDWLRHFDELRDPDLRRAEGLRQRENVRRLDISLHWVDWARAFTGALVAAV